MKLNAYATSGTSPTQPDFICENHDSVFLLRPISPVAFLWVHANLPAHRQMFGNAVAIDHNCVWAILDGIPEAGLVVSRG